MRSGAVVAALATGLLPAGVLGAAINPQTCSVESILEYFTCRRHISDGCFDNLAEQATAWCSSYLSIAPVTVYATTVTLVPSETVTETTVAATTTSTEVDVTTVEVPQTTTVTGVVETTIMETITLNGGAVTVKKRTFTVTFVPPTTTDSTIASVTDSTTASATTSASASAAVTAIATAAASSTVSVAPGCIDLAHKDLLRHPAARLSSACSCLDPTPTTITLDATTVTASTETVTDVSTVTDVESEKTVSTDLVTTVVTTQGITVTETSTATATVSPPPAVDPCAPSYNSANALRLGSSLVNSPDAETPYACCQLCQQTVGCILALFPAAGQCGLFISDGSRGGQCPGNVGYFPDTTGPVEDGSLFKGPCWAPGH